MGEKGAGLEGGEKLGSSREGNHLHQGLEPSWPSTAPAGSRSSDGLTSPAPSPFSEAQEYDAWAVLLVGQSAGRGKRAALRLKSQDPSHLASCKRGPQLLYHPAFPVSPGGAEAGPG